MIKLFFLKPFSFPYPFIILPSLHILKIMESMFRFIIHYSGSWDPGEKVLGLPTHREVINSTSALIFLAAAFLLLFSCLKQH